MREVAVELAEKDHRLEMYYGDRRPRYFDGKWFAPGYLDFPFNTAEEALAFSRLSVREKNEFMRLRGRNIYGKPVIDDAAERKRKADDEDAIRRRRANDDFYARQNQQTMDTIVHNIILTSVINS